MPILEAIHTEYISYSHSITTNKHDEFKIHCHPIYEIYYFVQGDVDYLIEGKRYHPEPHSMLLLSPYVFHGVRVNSEIPYERYSLHFNPDLLHVERRQLLLSAFSGIGLHSEKEIHYQDTRAFRMQSFLQSLSDVSLQPKALVEQLGPIYVEALLSQLTIMCKTLQPTQLEEAVSHTITEIIDWVNHHLNEPTTLDQLSEQFFISKHYLNRAFRKATGTTVGEYIAYKRATYAKQLLLNGYSAQEAALESGYSEYSTFYRSYLKVHGNSPALDMRLSSGQGH